MGDEASPFDWDDANTEHVARHSIEWWEAEEALLDPDRTNLARGEVQGEYRYTVAGRALSGHLLTVVYTVRAGKIPVVTARLASAHEQRIYRRHR